LELSAARDPGGSELEPPPIGSDEHDLLVALLRPFGDEAAARASTLLLAEYRTVGAALAAGEGRLRSLLPELGKAAAHLSAIRSAMLHVARDEALAEPVLAGPAALARYLRLEMAWLPFEQLRILFLAAGNRLVADEVVASGSVDRSPAPPRPILVRALELGASGLILVHNHPGGSPEPSRADIEATRELVGACRPLDIVVHDHLVVARSGWTSLRLLNLM
jgi:DNA repair protein RadC